MTNEIQVRIGGTFSESGFLPNGSFEGIYSYDPSSQDTNPNVNNVGVFHVPLFEIRIFDSESNLVDILNETNSIARIILSDLDSKIGADNYKFSTTQDTETNPNGFYEFGAIDLTFDWSFGGTTTSAPTMAPVDFEDGMFASYAATEGWDGFFNPQSVDNATVNIVNNEPPSTVTMEAEAADTIINYRTEKVKAASGRKVLSFLGGGQNEQGSATFGFNQVEGDYDIIVGTFDENDGLARFVVEHNDIESNTTTEIGTLELNQNLGSNRAKAQTFVSPIVATGVNLTEGDSITVHGFEDALEHARLDFIQFEPVVI